MKTLIAIFVTILFVNTSYAASNEAILQNAEGTAAALAVPHDSMEFLGCVANYHACEHLGHENGFRYHRISHDHRYCDDAYQPYACFGYN